MVKEKYIQPIMDVIRAKGCATRRHIIDELIRQFKLSKKQAERAATEALESLLKRGVIARKGRGVYCWLGG
jgi:predicted DNA-binding transcriptional regulator